MNKINQLSLRDTDTEITFLKIVTYLHYMKNFQIKFYAM